MFIKEKLEIAGCYQLFSEVKEDSRGKFVKTFHENEFEQNKLPLNFKEEYYSCSYKGVLRGLHFQLPPMDHEKIVYCPLGTIFDVVVDLRRDSLSYGKFVVCELSADKGNMIYIPTGMAHGFYTLSNVAIVMYKVTSVYSPGLDTGILWNSLDIPWPSEPKIVSARDKAFIPFNQFETPF